MINVFIFAEWITIKQHLLLHLAEDVQNVGDLRNTWCFPTERRCGGIKQVRGNGVDDCFFKNRHMHYNNLLQPPDILDIDEHLFCLGENMTNISAFRIQIEEITSRDLHSLLIIQ